MKEELLQMCGYANNEKMNAWAERTASNYSQFDEIVIALKDLEEFLSHSSYYLSLQSERDMINIRNDMLEEEEFLAMDAEILVWANEHNIELEEGFDQINILGFKKE